MTAHTPRRRFARALGVVAVGAVLAGCGDDGPATVVSAVATTTTVPASTPATVTTLPATAGDTTVPLTVPEGAVDLGHGVYLPVPDGYTLEGDDPVSFGNDDFTVVAQALARPAGEDPLVVAQEYLDLYDADFDAVAYTPLWYEATRAGEPPVQSYTLYYTSFADDDGIGVLGGLTVLVRGDGLVAVYDIYSTTEASGAIPADAFRTFADSVATAPLLGDVVAMPQRPPARVSSAHPFVGLDDLVGFTPAPGFEEVTAEPGGVRVSNGVTDFEVYWISGLTDVAAGIEASKQFVESRYADVQYEQPVDVVVPTDNLARQDMHWNGVYAADGRSCGGTTTVELDRTSGDAYVIISSFYWPDEGGQPDTAATRFMFRAFTDSFVAAP